METQAKTATNDEARADRSVARPTDGQVGEDGFTPEMHAIAHALTHPEGDPYDNARKMGFYCEQCG